MITISRRQLKQDHSTTISIQNVLVQNISHKFLHWHCLPVTKTVAKNFLVAKFRDHSWENIYGVADLLKKCTSLLVKGSVRCYVGGRGMNSVVRYVSREGWEGNEGGKGMEVDWQLLHPLMEVQQHINIYHTIYVQQLGCVRKCH